MDKRIVALQDWGCDTTGALKRMLDDEEFYLECLSSVEQDVNFANLGAALEQKKVEEAFDCAHALKGVLGNLGLTPMYEKTCELVEPLRKGEGANLEGEYQELMQMKSKLEHIL